MARVAYKGKKVDFLLVEVAASKNGKEKSHFKKAAKEMRRALIAGAF